MMSSPGVLAGGFEPPPPKEKKRSLGFDPRPWCPQASFSIPGIGGFSPDPRKGVANLEEGGARVGVPGRRPGFDFTIISIENKFASVKNVERTIPVGSRKDPIKKLQKNQGKIYLLLQKAFYKRREPVGLAWGSAFQPQWGVATTPPLPRNCQGVMGGSQGFVADQNCPPPRKLSRILVRPNSYPTNRGRVVVWLPKGAVGRTRG